MQNRKNILILTFVGLFIGIAALTQWTPVRMQFEIQKCIYFRNDHYSNIATLRGAPTYDEYRAESELMCRADRYYAQVIAVSQKSMEEDENDHTRMRIQPYYPVLASANTAEREAFAHKAIFYSDELIDKYGDDAYRKNRAVMNIALGNYDLAETDYDYFVEGNPRSYWTLEDRAILYAHIGQTEQALTDYKNLVEWAKQEPGTISEAYIEALEQAIVELENQ